MQQITPKLYQGDMQDALRSSSKSNIDVIIYLGQEIPLQLCFNCAHAVIHMPMNDGKNDLSKLRNIIFLTYIISSDNKKILIACRAGISRSILITSSLFALQNKMGFDEAYENIKKLVPQSLPELHLFQEIKQITEEMSCYI